MTPGPLSPQSINGSPLLYTDPHAYFAMRDASKGLSGLGSDTVARGGGSELVGDPGNPLIPIASPSRNNPAGYVESPSSDLANLWSWAKQAVAGGAEIGKDAATGMADALVAAGAMLLWPSSTEDQSADTPQYVVRGGISEPANLQARVGDLAPLGYPNTYGISASSAPNMTVDQIATVAHYPNRQISYTTNWALGAKGYPVQPTPYDKYPLHASIITPPSLTDEQAAAMSVLFAPNRRPNPVYGQ